MDFVFKDFQSKEGIDLKKDPLAVQRVREAVEKAKCELSTMLKTEISLPYISASAAGPKHLQMSVTRAQFEALSSKLIDKTIGPCKACLKDAGISPKDIQEVILVGGMTRMPKVIGTVRDFFGRDPFRGVNPDEVVAIGAAIQGGIIRGDFKEFVLLDVTPLSLGIETQGGVFAPLIPRNTRVPTTKSQTFSTAVDGQTHVNVRVFQGEREMVDGNKLLGEFRLMGIPPAPKGTAKIDVTFKIDADSVVQVSATDKSSGKSQEIKIEQHGGLTEAEIKKMIEDAAAHAEEDKKKRAEVEKRYEVEDATTQLEKSINENEKNLPADLLEKLKKGVAEVREALKGNDLKIVEEKYDALKTASLDMYTAINEAKNAKAEEKTETAEADTEKKAE
jgi:molecular chaperone DnaK